MDESARYNIGNVERNINMPTLPLALLTPAHRARFAFELEKRDETTARWSSSRRRRGRPTSRRPAAATCR